MVTGLFVLIAAFGGALVSVGVLLCLAGAAYDRSMRASDPPPREQDDELHGG